MTSNASSLPAILPELYADEIAQSRLAWMFETFYQEIVKEVVGPTGKWVDDTLHDYLYLSQLHVDLVRIRIHSLQ